METDDYMNKPFLVSKITLCRQDILDLYHKDDENYDAIKEIIFYLSPAVMEKIAQRLGAVGCREKAEEYFLDNLLYEFKDIVQPEE